MRFRYCGGRGWVIEDSSDGEGREGGCEMSV